MSLQDELLRAASSLKSFCSAAARKTILIIEGGTDERLLSVFVDDAQCDIVIAYGKPNALQALEMTRCKDIPGILCILDTDYLEFLGTLPKDDDIIFTDEHDLEVMLISHRRLMVASRNGVAGKTTTD